MTMAKETPDFMDSLIPAPALSQEIAKLVSWFLEQKTSALRDVPVSALETLGEYVRGRVHEDRCERLLQEQRDEQDKMDKLCQDLAHFVVARLERKDKPGTVDQEAFAIRMILVDGYSPEEQAHEAKQAQILRTLFEETHPVIMPTPVEGLSELWEKAPEAKPVPEIDIPRPAV